MGAAQTTRLREVAAASKVSISTASRALNGDPRISQATREEVEKAATRLRYRTDLIARSLSLRRTFTVGLIVGDIGNPFFADLARGIEAVLQTAQYVYLLANTDGNRARQREMASRLIERRVDGLLVTVPHDPEVLTHEDIPIVAIDRSPVKGVPFVCVDNIEGGRLAAEHLVQMGYQRIAILLGDKTVTSIADRFTGFVKGLRRAGRQLPAELQVICPTLNYQDAYIGAEKLLDAGADAIFAIGDVMAAASLAAGVDRGLKVPQDLGVVGYDDTPMASWPTLNLTSVAQSTVSLGREAARMILERIANPRRAVESVVLAPRLVVRNSSMRDAAEASTVRGRHAQKPSASRGRVTPPSSSAT